jgi:UDP-N-acetylmuramate--alanine ligase
VTGQLVVEGVRRADPDRAVIYTPHREETIAYLADEVRDGDLVITLGCGDIWMVGDAALARIRHQIGARSAEGAPDA